VRAGPRIGEPADQDGWAFAGWALCLIVVAGLALGFELLGGGRALAPADVAARPPSLDAPAPGQHAAPSADAALGR